MYEPYIHSIAESAAALEKPEPKASLSFTLKEKSDDDKK
jgi:hypothetical protein